MKKISIRGASFVKCFALLAVFPISQIGCLSLENGKVSNLPQLGGGGGGGGGGGTSYISFSASAIGSQSMELGDRRTVSMTVTNTATFAGSLSIGIHRDELDLVDTLNGVVITAIPNTLNLSPGASASVLISVQTKPEAPAFNDHFHVAISNGFAPMDIEQSVNLTIAPILVIANSAVTNGDSTWTFKDPMALPFLKQTAITVRVASGGTNVRWLNNSTVVQYIHGSNAIAHENTAGAGHGPGQVYSLNFTAPGQGGTYIHSQGSNNAGGETAGDDNRTINFVP